MLASYSSTFYLLSRCLLLFVGAIAPMRVTYRVCHADSKSVSKYFVSCTIFEKHIYKYVACTYLSCVCMPHIYISFLKNCTWYETCKNIFEISVKTSIGNTHWLKGNEKCVEQCYKQYEYIIQITRTRYLFLCFHEKKKRKFPKFPWSCLEDEITKKNTMFFPPKNMFQGNLTLSIILAFPDLPKSVNNSGLTVSGK